MVGFGGMMGVNANQPITGWLYQNPPAFQPDIGASQLEVGMGDSNAIALNAFRRFGFFALPFVTPGNLQAEAESGALGTGWTSVADAAASAGNTAKVASGTVTGHADLFGTSRVP